LLIKEKLLTGWRIEAVTPVKNCVLGCAGVKAKSRKQSRTLQ
jgi:hypothetical protein